MQDIFQEERVNGFHGRGESKNCFLSEGNEKVAEFSLLNVIKSWETFFSRGKVSGKNLMKNVYHLWAASSRIL